MTFNMIGKNVCLKQPEFKELDFVQWLWADNETMQEVGGPVALEDHRKVVWYEKMVQPTDGHNFYCLIYNNENAPIGEVSFHRFNKRDGTADFNIKIAHKFRGKGYAKEAMTLLLDYFFNTYGGEVMFDDVAFNNLSGQALLEKYGFKRKEQKANCTIFHLSKKDFFKLSLVNKWENSQ